jgi:transcriptional coactivator YAP1
MAFNNNNNNNGPSANSTSEDNDPAKKKNLIILVEKDSNDKLNELFDKTLGNKLPLNVPFRMRKLPDSFFKPPSSGSKSPSVSHSRENSADSAFGSGTTILGPAAIAAVANGLPIHHSRAHSSPASLGKIPVGLSLNPAQPVAANNNTPNTNSNAKPAPTLSSLNNNTTALSKTLQNIHSRGRSYDISSLHQNQFGELPPGWEQAKTQDGRIYYIK